MNTEKIKSKILNLAYGSRTHLSIINPDMAAVTETLKSMIDDGNIDFVFSDDYSYVLRSKETLKEIHSRFKKLFPDYDPTEKRKSLRSLVIASNAPQVFAQMARPDKSKYVIKKK